MGLTLTAAGARVILGSLPARTRPTGSDQQEAFWTAVVDGQCHLVLRARAGSGKSFTCAESMWQLAELDRSIRTTYVAFNKSIAEEFQSKLPPGSRASTMHSAGLAALRSTFLHEVTIDSHKVRKIVDTIIRYREGAARQARTALVRLVSLAKAHLMDGVNRMDLLGLALSAGIPLPIDWRDTVLDSVHRVLARCKADTRTIDFDDMVWLPTILDIDFPASDVLFVDEGQDLNACQHRFVQLMAGSGRLILVGDDRQAIYAFRGAATSSIGTLAAQLEATPRGARLFPLTRTRRCPASHVELARQLVPDLEAMPDAPRGILDVISLRDYSATSPWPGTMILCRTNAPLVSEAYRIALEGTPVAIQGRDIGESMVGMVESVGGDTVPEYLHAVEANRARALEMIDTLGGGEDARLQVHDQHDCLRAAAQGCDAIGDVVARIRHLFRDVAAAEQRSCVLLSSVHRAKGREARRVVIIRPDLMPHRMAASDEAREQELNIAYVAVTRSMDGLTIAGQLPNCFTMPA